jgi:hypothetical protein
MFWPRRLQVPTTTPGDYQQAGRCNDKPQKSRRKRADLLRQGASGDKRAAPEYRHQYQFDVYQDKHPFPGE